MSMLVGVRKSTFCVILFRPKKFTKRKLWTCKVGTYQVLLPYRLLRLCRQNAFLPRSLRGPRCKPSVIFLKLVCSRSCAKYISSQLGPRKHSSVSLALGNRHWSHTVHVAPRSSSCCCLSTPDPLRSRCRRPCVRSRGFSTWRAVLSLFDTQSSMCNADGSWCSYGVPSCKSISFVWPNS